MHFIHPFLYNATHHLCQSTIYRFTCIRSDRISKPTSEAYTASQPRKKMARESIWQKLDSTKWVYRKSVSTVKKQSVENSTKVAPAIAWKSSVFLQAQNFAWEIAIIGNSRLWFKSGSTCCFEKCPDFGQASLEGAGRLLWLGICTQLLYGEMDSCGPVASESCDEKCR